MEIIRENDIDRVEFSLRVKVSLRKLNLLRNFLDENFKYKIYQKKSLIRILIDVEGITMPVIIKTLLKDYKLNLKNVDMWISIRSSYDMGGLTIPKSVLNIIKEIDCDLNFSYVVC